MRVSLSVAGFIAICLITVSCEDSTSITDGNLWTSAGTMVAANTSGIPDSVINEYFEDAASLALRDIHENEALKDSLIIIPPEIVDLYFHSLLHVYNAGFIPERDCWSTIHCFCDPITHRLKVGVDSTAGWVENWRKGNRFTGNEEIDLLMEEYEIQMEKYHSYPFGHSALLNTSDPLNILALSAQFTGISGIRHASPDHCSHIGSTDDISGHYNRRYVELNYYCPYRPQQRYRWIFRVYYNGFVELIN